MKPIERLKDTLRDYRIEGIKTNIPLLEKIVESNAFQNGETTTNFISINI